MSNDNSIGKLTAALAAISKAVGSLAPDKRNKEQNYDYISADKILSSIGKEMATAGVVVIPSITDDNFQTVTYNSYGKEKNRIDARASFVMVVSHESGESINMPWVGYGTDYVTPDKALYKAITSGHKYFLMKLFNVGIGNEDGEHEAHSDEEVTYTRPPKPRPAPPQSPRTAVRDESTTPTPESGTAAENGPSQSIGVGFNGTAVAAVYHEGDEVMVKGKSDEKPGTVQAVFDDGKIQVKVDGRLLTVSRDKLTLVNVQGQAPLFDEPAQATDTTYAE